jgi:hypothetical protein
MAQSRHPTPSLAHPEEALTVLFCLIDDAYALLNSHDAQHYESIKLLSDSEVIALALFQHLRGVQSEPSFFRDIERFLSHLYPGGVGLTPPRSIPEGSLSQPGTLLVIDRGYGDRPLWTGGMRNSPEVWMLRGATISYSSLYCMWLSSAVRGQSVPFAAALGQLTGLGARSL